MMMGGWADAGGALGTALFRTKVMIVRILAPFTQFIAKPLCFNFGLHAWQSSKQRPPTR